MNSTHIRLLLEGLEKKQGDSGHCITIRIPKFELRRREIVAIVGANGCGKSTMLDMVAMLLQPDKVGKFVFVTDCGESLDLSTLGSRQICRIRRNNIAYILQSGGLLEFLTIKQNISLVRRLKGGRQANLDEITTVLGIEDILHKKPAQLSGGQRQKGAIARALVQEPDIILADEPTSAMDSLSAGRLMDILTKRVRSSGTSLILVSHDPALVKKSADRVYQFKVTEKNNKKLVSTLYRTKFAI